MIALWLAGAHDDPYLVCVDSQRVAYFSSQIV
jgi:hypothetical protein